MTTSEKHIEDAVVKYAQSRGVRVYKFLSEIDKGMPDRIFFHRHKTWLIEFKRPKGRLSPTQELRHAELEGHVAVYVVSDVGSGKALIDGIIGPF